MATASYERSRTARRRAPRRRGVISRIFGFFLGTTRFLIATTLFFILMSLLGYLVVGQYIRGEEIPAPNLIARPIGEAMEMARKANLYIALEQREPHDTVPKDEIISQQPAPDTMIKTRTPVHVVVSSGSPLMTVPDLRGQSRVVAGMRLRNAGLDVGNVTEIPVPGLSGGLVQSTDPPAGSGVAAINRRVNLLVSAGKVEDAHVMPDLVGLTIKDARDVLQGLGLAKAAEHEAPAADTLPGQIHAQDPAPGTPVVRTTPISVTFSPEVAVAGSDGGQGTAAVDLGGADSGLTHENMPTSGPGALGPGFGSGR